MKKFLSIFIAVAMVMSLAGMFNASTAMASNPTGTQNGMSITQPTAGSTVRTTSLQVSGTFDTDQPADYEVILTVTANSQSHEYTYTLPNTQSTWGPITVPASDFDLTTDGSQSYPTALEAILQDKNGIPVTGIDSGEVDITWNPGATPPTPSVMVGSVDKASSGYKYIDPYPGSPTDLFQGSPISVKSGTLSNTTVADDVYKIPIYTMGEYITGKVDDEYDYDTVELRKTDGTFVQSSNIAANRFRLPTNKVTQDGVYAVYAVNSSTSAEGVVGYVFIEYNVTIDQTSLDYGKPNYISGCVKDGKGAGVNNAVVFVLYPDGDYYVAAKVDGGQFNMTIDPNEKGVYSIAVIDGYPTVAGNNQVSTADNNNTVDSFVYKQFCNTTFNWSLDTFVDPTILYDHNAGEQTFVLKLSDEDGNPVTDKAENFTVTGLKDGYSVKEISAGFYKFIGTVAENAKYVKVKVSGKVGGVSVSASKTLTVTSLGVWNPQVVVDAYYSNDSYPHIGREVFDKLPCTVGNSLEIYPILYEPSDSTYTVHSWDAIVDGPVTMVDNADYLMDHSIDNSKVSDPTTNDEDNVNGVYLVNASGTVTVHFEGVVWENGSGYSLPESDFTVGKEVKTCCTVGKITQTKNDDGTYDIKIPVSGESLYEIVAHIYAINDVADGEPNGDLDLWYNPIPSDKNPGGTNIDDLPITFDDTNVDFERDGDTLIIKNVDLSGLCDDTFVVQVFGTVGTGEQTTHPLVYENKGDITSPKNVTDISAKADVDKLVAGVPQTITITAPDFSGTLDVDDWTFSFNGVETTDYTMEDMGDGTYVLNLDPALSDEGTFEIVGEYTDGCDVEEAVIDIPVILPEFTVQIGLKDGATIENDNIITEGFKEKIYVTATNPLTGEEITLQNLSVSPKCDDYDVPSCKVKCDGVSPATVWGFGNPNVECDPQFKLYAEMGDANILVDTFTLVPPTVKVDPEVVPYTIPATKTNVTFTVTDAHGHVAPDVEVTATGYGDKPMGGGITGTDGKVVSSLAPERSEKYTVGISFDDTEDIPDDWIPNDFATIEAKYQVKSDTEAPKLTVTAPEDGATVNTDTVKVEGIATDNVDVASLYINGEKIDFLPDGSFSKVIQLTEGTNTIKVLAFDAANNKAEKDITVTYEKPAPAKKTVITVQIGSDVMTVNGQVEQLDVPPVIHEGHTYLPLRAIAEALGAKVDWIAETKGITLTLGDSTVGLQIGNVSAVVNGNVVAIFPPYLQPYGDGTYAATMVPLRVIAEGLGAEVNWDPATRVVTITLVQQP